MENRLEGLNVALVHDWLVGQGGGERVLHDLHLMFPDAPIYTLVYDRAKAPDWLEGCNVRTTYIQRWPGGKSHYKLLLSFMPKAWEALDLTEFDLVISTCASCCKGVITRPDALHACYCFSPTRYVWDLYHEYLSHAGRIKRAFMPRMIHKVRMWDFAAAQRPDCFVADSEFVGSRIEKFYRRDSKTIYPGVAPNPHASVVDPEDYYLVVSRFVRYKRVDIAVEACNLLGRRLVVIGSGGEEEGRLRALAGPTVEFVGKVVDDEMQRYYAGARGFLFPGVEDFGITPVEAMTAGVPVLAYGEGGALETVVDGETGLFFHPQTVQGMVACIERFESCGVSRTREEIRERGLSFSRDRFEREMRDYLQEQMARKRRKGER